MNFWALFDKNQKTLTIQCFFLVAAAATDLTGEDHVMSQIMFHNGVSSGRLKYQTWTRQPNLFEEENSK